ncbi:MAG TPA: bifunctional phosphoglucose/phosphomannose isomerase [Desulfotomaculum sp.]|nr:bifunctional phosphoglucose/phosphomannose isomerase [Desulfotomaculum sp.]
MVVNLDDYPKLKELDRHKMLDALAQLPEQCREALQLGKKAALSPVLPLMEEKEIAQVVVTGLGGSAIGGDLLRTYIADKVNIPVVVNRHYELARFVGPRTLLFAVSYSGNTEETISAYRQAKAKGAAVVVLTSGGALKEMARQDNIPVITVPTGFAPRAALGYLFIPILVVLENLHLLNNQETEVNALVSHLKELSSQYKPEVPLAKNYAKLLAGQLHNRLPVIWGSSGTTEVAAQRWKGQINENAKTPAYWNVLPELNHNEIVGLEGPAELLQRLYLIILSHPHDHPQVQKRISITKELVAGVTAGVSEINASGTAELARLFSLIYLGDYTSVYLAFLYGVDPGPVKVIDRLKKALREEK